MRFNEYNLDILDRDADYTFVFNPSFVLSPIGIACRGHGVCDAMPA
jgi:hypothetical protein